MENKRPITTLFILMSLDGKISTGATDQLDVDQDFPKIDGVKEGLNQYYEIEQTMDYYSLNTGRVMAKIGVNEKKAEKKIDCEFIIIDREPHLDQNGVRYLCDFTKRLLLVTDNLEHPAFKLKNEISNLEILYYQEGIDLKKMLEDLKENYHVERITIQSGGTLNGEFLKSNLFDYVHIVIAPVLIGGKDTSTLVDGESIMSIEELNRLRSLKLITCKVLKDSYVELIYKVNR
ncbi:MAG: dihydrofolate reductase family protein [Clostridia bacterium]|nr:dihydrofolate reductase family protein [Clostridia bacterium]